MKYSIVSEAGGLIKRLCDSERYLAADASRSSHFPWLAKYKYARFRRHECQFMRSAKLPIRDGIVNSPKGSLRPSPGGNAARGDVMSGLAWSLV